VTLLEHVASKIRELRRTHGGLSQENLAKGLGVATNTVSRWETGVYKPALEDLEKLARYFKVSILEFFPDHNPEAKPELNALMRAAGTLPDEDLKELQQYAEYRRAQHMYKSVKPPKQG
jgi:transcriptional regulator with XRE-family HTH domain